MNARVLLGVLMTTAIATAAEAAPPAANYDEAKVGTFTLPDPLVMADGTRVTDAKTWRERRRPELLRLFEEHMYGRAPGRPAALAFTIAANDTNALGGKATRREVDVWFAGEGREPHAEVLIYLPNDAKKPVPVFLSLNFQGNASIQPDPGIRLSKSWMAANVHGVVSNRATEASRGTQASRWPVEHILARGYGVATVYYGDIDPDFDDGFQNGVHPLFYAPGQTRPASNEWASIAAWAWGLSRVMDYLETDRDVDAKHVAVLGHSRQGKTSLWAGASDERFALTISNDSGCGGAALSRREFGESLPGMNEHFPHWFCANFHRYGGHENDLPFDQHELIALIAPRPVYVASAEEDRWADPKGEFLSAAGADPVYRLLGTSGIEAKEMPAVSQPLARGTIGYHIRPGKHDVTDYDWDRYMDFADLHFRH